MKDKYKMKIKGDLEEKITSYIVDRELEEKDKSSRIYEHFINISWISKEYLDKSTNGENVRDYIAGMTDRYFERVFKETILPKRVTTFRKGEVSSEWRG